MAASLRPELIVFDCDGVLVDSEPIANRVMAEAITALGWPLTTADCIARFKGHHFDTVIAVIEDRLGRPVPKNWLPDLRAATDAAFQRELEPVPGVFKALDAVAASGTAICVASQGPLEKMAVSLAVTGLRARFEGRIFSAYQVARGKPHPHGAFLLTPTPLSYPHGPRHQDSDLAPLLIRQDMYSDRPNKFLVAKTKENPASDDGVSRVIGEITCAGFQKRVCQKSAPKLVTLVCHFK